MDLGLASDPVICQVFGEGSNKTEKYFYVQHAAFTQEMIFSHEKILFSNSTRIQDIIFSSEYKYANAVLGALTF